jgi:quercetin dioxygenase-like cupin family protein
VRTWNLLEIETDGGTRSPVVLQSDPPARAVLISLDPGQELGDHQVKEYAYVVVVEGTVILSLTGGEDSVEAGVGTLALFQPDERHTVASETGARILLFLAPWPGDGHYRGEERDLERGL